MRLSIALALSTLSVVLPERSSAAGDPTRGARLFMQCAACHSTAPGEDLTGPSLAHVLNHKAGTAEGFGRYSEPLKRSRLVWNDKTLDAWLASPEKVVPGTSMTFRGLADPQARQDVIAYLQAVDKGNAPQAPQGGGGMMGMAQKKPDLKTVPPAAQVRSIRHCGDTYTVETADGKSEKVWEYNLRFKTDSSPVGPAPGKPVAVGAGMQGDRASIIFATPKEISEAIKEQCP